MGFLSAYSGTRRVHIGDDTSAYWVELREHVSQGAKEGAERMLSNMLFVDGKAQPNPDVARYRQMMVHASIENWNLDDDNGVIWPINLQNVKRLPGTVFDQLWAILDEIAAPADATERRQFPDAGVGGDQDGWGPAPEPLNVPDGARTVEAPRLDA
jgi:hypothetical protein